MTNEKFFGEHPTLQAGTTTYTKLDIDGEVIEHWVKDDNEWCDRTELKRAERQVAQLRKELLKLTEKED
jgi:hypothetical protein